jgi:hypothetical protein
VNVHAPEEHATLFACWTCVLQLVVHDPQCVSVVLTFVSHPVLPLLQCAKPEAHVHEHWLAEHFGVPFVVLHRVPQPPQLKLSALVSMQNPVQQLLPFVQGVPPSVLHSSAHTPDGLHFFGDGQSPSAAHSTHV